MFVIVHISNDYILLKLISFASRAYVFLIACELLRAFEDHRLRISVEEDFLLHAHTHAHASAWYRETCR